MGASFPEGVRRRGAHCNKSTAGSGLHCTVPLISFDVGWVVGCAARSAQHITSNRNSRKDGRGGGVCQARFKIYYFSFNHFGAVVVDAAICRAHDDGRTTREKDKRQLS